MTTTHDTDWDALAQAEDFAYFRGDLCLSSPESYSLEEKREICEDMLATSKAIDDAMRADFESYPPELRIKLLDMLCESGCMTPEFWKEVLLGETPDYPDQIIESAVL